MMESTSHIHGPLAKMHENSFCYSPLTKHFTPISTTVIQICKCKKPQKIISYFYMLSTPRIFSNSLLLPLNLRYLHLVSFYARFTLCIMREKCFSIGIQLYEKCIKIPLYHPRQCLFIDCIFIFTKKKFYLEAFTFYSI